MGKYLEEEIRFLRPKEDTESWFSVLVLHQNRPIRMRERSTGGHVPENLIPSFFDLVVWGHEHECKIGQLLVLFSALNSAFAYYMRVVHTWVEWYNNFPIVICVAS